MLHVNIRSVIINDMYMVIRMMCVTHWEGRAINDMYMVIRMMCVTDWEGRDINNSPRDLSSKKGPILDF